MLFAAILSLLATVLLPPVHGPVERTVYAMGTVLRATAEAGEPGRGARALEEAVRQVERAEALLSTWDPRTPMGRINAAPVGAAVRPTREVLDLLLEVDAWAQRTEGAFHPAVGALVDAWDLRGDGRRPTQVELAAARAATGTGGVRFDAEAGDVTRLRPGAWVDSGGFGKGAGLRWALRALRAGGVDRALLDFGGQILAVTAPGERSWEVAVAHPDRRDEAVAWLRLANASVATSGNSERGITVNGERLGHVLDPRTGTPVPDWGSVTVVARDPLEADILSTALYVLGPDAGTAWASRRPDVGVLFLVRSGQGVQILPNRAMERWLVTPPATAGMTTTPSPERRLP